jgi:ferredoxin-NADP reductase
MVINLKLAKKEQIANGTMAFHFEKPEGLEFRAGQFADFTLIDPSETDAEGDVRGFSLAAAPYENDIFIATRMRDTAFKRVIQNLLEGSEVKFDGPYGDFTLHKNETIPAVFIIGGIGVNPARSMIAQATHDKTAHKIILLHSSRTPADLPFLEDFKALTESNPNFTYIPVASDEAPENWQGETGRVDAAMIKKYVPDLAGPKVYVSGPEGMVKAMRQLLVELEVDEDTIRTEEFSGY